MRTKHTVLPWQIFKRDDPLDDSDPNLDIIAPSIASIATLHKGGWLGSDEHIANAEFIVQACNSHYELLEACKKLVTAVQSWHTGEWFDALVTGKQAIAKVEPKERG